MARPQAKTQRDASETALMLQPAVDKIAYQDNGWLRHEISEQQAELERVGAPSCAPLFLDRPSRSRRIVAVQWR
jgi:hypothetical protein